MKFFIKTLIVMSMSFSLNGQIISQFNFDSNPVTAAQIGPDASSFSASSYSDINGVGGTNGLNAGIPKADLNFTIPGSPTFDVPGIDVQFDYQREESFGHFWRRGNSLVISGTANLSVRYRVEDGAGGFSTVTSGNVYAIPDDDIFRTYRFYYTPSTGVGTLLVDGVIVWSFDGPDDRNMYWGSSGDVVIGDQLDGSGANKTFLDNVIVSSIDFSPLPIELISFEGIVNDDNQVELYWSTATEINNDYFTIESSINGNKWKSVLRHDGAGTTTLQQDYFILDTKPNVGVSYYRLKQTDFDEAFSYSKTITVEIDKGIDVVLYPNPCRDFLNLKFKKVNDYQIEVINTMGISVNIEIIESFEGIKIDVTRLDKGTYFLVLVLGNQKEVTQFEVL